MPPSNEIDTILFPGRERLRAVAWHLGDHVDAKSLHQAEHILPGEFHPVGGGYAIVFRFGAMAVIEVEPDAAVELRTVILKHTSEARADFATEEAVIAVSPEGVEDSGRTSTYVEGGTGIPVPVATAGRLQIIASVMAKSAALAHYESQVGGVFERIEPLARSIQQGNARTGDRELLRLLGDATLTQMSTTGRMEVRDKPDPAWDRPELDRLWRALSDDYELAEREAILSRKLGLISSTTSTFYQLLQANQTHRVEWYIAILIVFEIIIIVYEMLP